MITTMQYLCQSGIDPIWPCSGTTIVPNSVIYQVKIYFTYQCLTSIINSVKYEAHALPLSVILQLSVLTLLSPIVSHTDTAPDQAVTYTVGVTDRACLTLSDTYM